jgi:hypothetical protein
MMSLGLVLIYFLRGSCPWSGIPAATQKQKYERILQRKEAAIPVEVCQGQPQEFEQYLRDCLALEFTDTPDYRYCIALYFMFLCTCCTAGLFVLRVSRFNLVYCCFSGCVRKMIKMFSDLFETCGFERDYIWDWNVPRGGGTDAGGSQQQQQYHQSGRAVSSELPSPPLLPHQLGVAAHSAAQTGTSLPGTHTAGLKAAGGAAGAMGASGSMHAVHSVSVSAGGNATNGGTYTSSGTSEHAAFATPSDKV